MDVVYTFILITITASLIHGTITECSYCDDEHIISDSNFLNKTSTVGLPTVDVTDVILEQFLSCGLQNIVFISDSEAHSGQVDVLEKLVSPRIPVIDLQTSQSWLGDKFHEFFQKFYWEMKMYNFVIMSTRYRQIITRFNEAFLKESAMSLAAHNIKLCVLIQQEERGLSRNDLRLNKLDNVAFLTYSTITLGLIKAETLMWRKKRTRQFDDFSHSLASRQDSKNKICLMYPNMKNKLNGRELRVHAKEFMNHVKRVQPEGQRLYEGFMIDIVNTLAMSFNFTYVIVPNNTHNVTWQQQIEYITAGKAELGIPGWAMSSANEYSVTSPIFFDQFKAVYFSNANEESYVFNTFLTKGFKQEVSLILLASFFVTFVLGLVLDNCTNLSSKSSGGNKVFREVQCDSPDQGGINTDEDKMKSATYQLYCRNQPSRLGANFETPKQTGDIISQVYTTKFPDLFFGLIGTIFEQGSLPSTKPMRVRVVFWSWQLLVLVICAVYKGFLTADRIQPSQPHRFTSYEEILASNIDLCIPDWDVTYLNTMRTADRESLLNKLYQKSEDYKIRNPEKCRTISDLEKMFKTKENVIILGVINEMEYAMPRNITDLVYMKETLLSSAFGIVTPKGSELKSIFSEAILRLTDQGIEDLYYRKWKEDFNNGHENTPDKDNTHKLKVFTCLFFWCGIGLLASLIALVMEQAIYHIYTKRKMKN